jgi:hypothetical protein
MNPDYLVKAMLQYELAACATKARMNVEMLRG